MAQTQHQIILEHLQTHDSITPWEAFEKYGITKLATRISELRRKLGHEIADEFVNGKDRRGAPVTYKRYFILPMDQEAAS